MAQKILTYCFYLLFFLTPLVWTPLNYELFEYSKMIFVYILTIVVVTTWLIKMVRAKALLIKKTPLDIPLLLFLGANILSTIFSVDHHTSIWGYYSRSNGGLLSLISYLLLYYALLSNFSSEYVPKFLKTALLGGLVVSLWAIPEHFGVSPSCLLLTGQLNTSCWVQDVQARVFATLGQPNWLAIYLGMLIFPTIYFCLMASRRILTTYYLLLTTLFYLAFTFTYSRGATLGLLGGLGVIVSLKIKGQLKAPNLRSWLLLPLVSMIILFLGINLFFGSALTSFKLISRFAAPVREAVTIPVSQPAGTQLETGGTESGQIRLIVWRGALEIFKHYPILGSGVETFAYSYYQFRPVEHNLVSEWDFLYNKAHNEFLNYLATTGILGFSTYLAIIFSFIFWSIKKRGNSIFLASYLAYLIANFFGFSVVITALFFYLFPALALLSTDSLKSFSCPKITLNPVYLKITQVIIVILGGALLLTIIKYWVADIFFAEGFKASERGQLGRSFARLEDAVILNPGEPYYLSELGYTKAAAAVSLAESDATSSATFKKQAEEETSQVSRSNPSNVSYLRTAARVYFLLSTIDPSFTTKTLTTLDKAISLAPTDAKLFYNKALILGQAGRRAEAIDTLEQTIKLKSNYPDAYKSLATLYFEEGEKSRALDSLKQALKLVPSDQEALDSLRKYETH